MKPSGWTQRRAPGQIQMARSDLLLAYTRFQKALVDYDNLLAQIQDRAALFSVQYNVNKRVKSVRRYLATNAISFHNCRSNIFWYNTTPRRIFTK